MLIFTDLYMCTLAMLKTEEKTLTERAHTAIPTPLLVAIVLLQHIRYGLLINLLDIYVRMKCVLSNIGGRREEGGDQFWLLLSSIIVAFYVTAVFVFMLHELCCFIFLLSSRTNFEKKSNNDYQSYNKDGASQVS